LGAGLVGSVLAVLLRKRGYEVTVYERRPDMHKEAIGAGRSINLAMSNRGWKTLELAGLRQDIEAMAIPLPGRFLHQELLFCLPALRQERRRDLLGKPGRAERKIDGLGRAAGCQDPVLPAVQQGGYSLQYLLPPGRTGRRRTI
jgi:glycine/D-amino acid oxidase-like deaminating enzyme